MANAFTRRKGKGKGVDSPVSDEAWDAFMSPKPKKKKPVVSRGPDPREVERNPKDGLRKEEEAHKAAKAARLHYNGYNVR